jgi:hypothetical protein
MRAEVGRSAGPRLLIKGHPSVDDCAAALKSVSPQHSRIRDRRDVAGLIPTGLGKERLNKQQQLIEHSTLYELHVCSFGFSERQLATARNERLVRIHVRRCRFSLVWQGHYC